jgi:NAD+ synthase
MDSLTIALAQTNPTLGALAGNADMILKTRAEAAEAGADLVVFSELCVCGYPPEDLVHKPFFLDQIDAQVARLAEATGDGGPGIIVGAPVRRHDKLYNAGLLLDGGAVVGTVLKADLPNYSVFDEKRLFQAGPMPGPVSFRGVRLGLIVCEDMWTPDATECLEETGAEILVVINGSPFDDAKLDTRIGLAVARVKESGLPLVYVNQVGGQDELVFDGASFVLSAEAELRAHLPSFQSHTQITRWERREDGWTCHAGDRIAPPEGFEADYRAMMLGLSDYLHKNRFPGVIIGLSGGIDSALSAAVAVDALGADKVHCVMMPSPYTSSHSLEDAEACAQMLGVRYDTIPIKAGMEAFDTMLGPIFGDLPPDTTEENIQSRLRGVTLMALSNKFGHMLLTTGNKSEMSVGYSTLYGDMCGGYSVLKDVYKTSVYDMARWRNGHRPAGALGPEGAVMPERIITKAPSAELKPDQTDQDSLPAYEVLDDILRCLIEHDLGLPQILERGHDKQTVSRVWRMLDMAEYKRRQAPPGVKLTSRAFGKDRRYPITNAFTSLL